MQPTTQLNILDLKKKQKHCIFSAFPQEGGIYAITGQENRWLYEHVA